MPPAPQLRPLSSHLILLALILGLAPVCARAGDAPASVTDDASIDHSVMDQNADPCGNFFRYACGGWIDANPIPADESGWGLDHVLALHNREKLRAILDKAVARPTPDTQKIGDFYASCMDESAIEKVGLSPLKPMLERIDALTVKDQLPPLLAQLHRAGVEALFRFGAGQDAKDAESQIAIADQGGMGLPDRDYYLKTDPSSVKLRDDYRAHIVRMLVLAGENQTDADKHANTVLSVETALAKGALDRVARRDPQQTYHRLERAELDTLTPGFDWAGYFADVGAPQVKLVDITEKKFFQNAAHVIAAADLGDLKTYLKWHLISGAATWLPKALVDENFAFYGTRLTGTTENKPRWKRCVDIVDEALGEDLGRAYVADAYPPEAKAGTEAMVTAISTAFEDDLKTLDWMSPETKAKALVKLGQMRKKLGYPDHWRDYGEMTVTRGDMLGNASHAAGFELQRELNKIGKPIDRGEWGMSPPTVNAYYDPQMNDINLPAGILQPPFFSPKYDDAVNFGATAGGTVGHEMTHGFDDEGRQYDGRGNLTDWWTKADAVKFSRRAQCVVDQYSAYTAVDNIHINGRLTLGENVADLGGVRLGYVALMNILAKKPVGLIGGFTPAQRYFIAYAQSWCGATRPESIRLRTATDPHSPPEFRVNGVVSDLPEFRAAFSCKANAAMVRAKVCRVW
ncbi:MAG: Endothelin-converting enzyme 1 [Rhodospirillales bacterium]|nr:Endothelin-converting enzyme 1 [Rhodospirillales bacterium]